MTGLKKTHSMGDGLTFYESSRNNDGDGWISVDLGKPESIDYIRYLPRNDDNNITPGNRYELFYFSEKEWKSLGEMVAQADSLVYDDVPSNGLYWLRNLTRGKEERIFTYNKNRQVWW